VGALLTGLTRAEAAVLQPEAWAALGSGGGIPGGGESMEELEGRLAAALDDLAARYAGELFMLGVRGGSGKGGAVVMGRGSRGSWPSKVEPGSMTHAGQRLRPTALFHPPLSQPTQQQRARQQGRGCWW